MKTEMQPTKATRAAALGKTLRRLPYLTIGTGAMFLLLLPFALPTERMVVVSVVGGLLFGGTQLWIVAKRVLPLDSFLRNLPLLVMVSFMQLSVAAAALSIEVTFSFRLVRYLQAGSLILLIGFTLIWIRRGVLQRELAAAAQI